MFWKVLSKFSSASFKRATGVHKEVFLELTEIVSSYKKIHRKSPSSGRKAYLIIEDQLLMYLMYIREYRTQFHVGIAFGLSESRVCECVKIIEDIIIQDKRYHLSGKKELLKSENSIEVVIIDVGESPLERPKKKQRSYYSGKKKRHTHKFQAVINKSNKKVICTDFARGRKHDFKLYRESKTHISKDKNLKVDTGYQGIVKLHANTDIPQKRSKKNPLTKEAKKMNRKISGERVTVEHVIREIKIFRIISERYRNRRKRFGLRVNLIAAFYNRSIDLNLKK
jgi:hypothetical protein